MFRRIVTASAFFFCHFYRSKNIAALSGSIAMRIPDSGRFAFHATATNNTAAFCASSPQSNAPRHEKPRGAVNGERYFFVNLSDDATLRFVFGVLTKAA